MKTVSAFVSKSVLVAVGIASCATLSASDKSSLWLAGRAGETAMFGDRRARQVGDILTVMVQESASVQASLRTKTDKSGAVDASVTSFFFDPASSSLGTHNGALPSTSFGGSSNFTGGGEITNRQSITARAAVTVIDVLPNGNLVIEGSRYVAYSGEKQYAVLRGIVRPADIQSGNTVLSSSIADARVEFLSRGSISSAQRKGWLTRVVDLVNPF
ncbi:flagellar basal body L-ring protein FlgH [Opitutales bacterium ASA1]|jgi:flagellar L-ring protein precursor FlgH|uniref:flagellar basal body L-ring protein FlgH n=1 Tax=Congregicoccus parvus TaxID=3081749 RepID=UPI002B2C174C|nr:flagellar basal body L-ring protein FlgH [Opitutales bacterium ASA1]